MALTEFGKPIRYAVRVHEAAGVLGKDIALVLVVLTKAQALCILSYPTGTAEAPDLRCTCALRPSHPPARALRDGSSARKALVCKSFWVLGPETSQAFVSRETGFTDNVYSRAPANDATVRSSPGLDSDGACHE